MTKKFWKDWQRRFGETEDVVIYKNYGTEHQYDYPILCGKRYDKIVDAEWFTDSVILKIERYTEIMAKKGGLHYALMGVFPFFMLRTDIKTIYFKKKK